MGFDFISVNTSTIKSTDDRLPLTPKSTPIACVLVTLLTLAP